MHVVDVPPVFSKRGFTLIELLVVLSIIAVLALGIMSVLFNARKDAHDTLRVNTTEQLKLGVRLYKESEGVYPDYADAIEIDSSETGSLYDELGAFMKGLKPDPLGADGYGFWYDSDFNCTASGQRVVLVQQVELPENSNFSTECAGAAGELPPGWDSSLVFIKIIQ
jgi:prepilin-type N-terminal cleavage/methylation domain-containing protein